MDIDTHRQKPESPKSLRWDEHLAQSQIFTVGRGTSVPQPQVFTMGEHLAQPLAPNPALQSNNQHRLLTHYMLCLKSGFLLFDDPAIA